MFKEATDTNFDLDRHLVKLLADSPFFSEISRHVRKIVTRDLPTAGVAFNKHNDDFVMGVNPDFFATMSDDEIGGVLRHELYHIILFHVTSRRRTPHMRWNVATDLAINSIILSPESRGLALPDSALVPGRPLKLGPGKENAAAAKISKLIESLPVMESSDFYWDKLSELADELQSGCPVHGKGAPGGGKKPGPGEKGDKKSDDKGSGSDPGDKDQGSSGGEESGGHEEGEGEGHNHGEAGEECTCGASGWSLDDHSGWDALSDEEREYAEARARNILEKAAKRADSSSNGWGSVPSAIRDEIRRVVSRKVDWKLVLRQFVGSITRGGRSSTIRRINRKYPMIHPGVKRGYVAKLAVAIDQSGSVGDDMLAAFFSELSSLTKKVAVTVIPFDYDVAEDAVFEWRKGGKPRLQRVRQGGTSFDAPTQFINSAKNRGRWDGVLFLTDGGAPRPIPSRVKRGWILGEGCQLAFTTDEMQVSMEKNVTPRGAWR